MGRRGHILCAAALGVVLVLAWGGLVERPIQGSPPTQWTQALGNAPVAVNQRPRETPPTVAPAEQRDPASDEEGWIGWALLVGIPALIIVWIFGRRRRFRRGPDRDRD